MFQFVNQVLKNRPVLVTIHATVLYRVKNIHQRKSVERLILKNETLLIELVVEHWVRFCFTVSRSLVFITSIFQPIQLTFYYMNLLENPIQSVSKAKCFSLSSCLPTLQLSLVTAQCPLFARSSCKMVHTSFLVLDDKKSKPFFNLKVQVLATYAMVDSLPGSTRP